MTYVGEINKTVKATAKKDAYVVLTPETSANGNVSAPVNQNGDRYKNLESRLMKSLTMIPMFCTPTASRLTR